jgi:hypothetical protein
MLPFTLRATHSDGLGQAIQNGSGVLTVVCVHAATPPVGLVDV